MKSIIAAILVTVPSLYGASTVNISNFASATSGLPIVSSTGAALTVGTFNANAGYFSTTVDWGTATAATIISAFVGIDASPLNTGTRTGLFTGQTFNGALPVGFAGKQAYVVVADNANFLLATKFAVYEAGVAFTAPDTAGNSAQSIAMLDSSKVVFGNVLNVSSQPSNLTGAAFAKGVELVTVMVPETSTALLGALGALGLLRRRR